MIPTLPTIQIDLMGRDRGRGPRGPDENFEGTYIESGWVPAQWLERVAICMVDGGCTKQMAYGIAARELAASAMTWVPNRK